jgi:putative spermidine/putrescine transport system permease protein
MWPANSPSLNLRRIIDLRLLLLGPLIIFVLVFFGGGLLSAICVSLGSASWLENSGVSLQYYRALVADPTFVDSLLWTFYLAFCSTFIAVVLAVTTALMLRETLSRSVLVLFQFIIALPYLAAALGMTMLLSQSGLLSRLTALLGITEVPADFIALTNDSLGVGIIATYVWKETPFITLLLLSGFNDRMRILEDTARTLGASPLQCLRTITLPRMLPLISVAAILVFAFTFGSFEVPLLLGPTYPESLPVKAWNAYRSTELNDRPLAMVVAIVITAMGALLSLVYLKITKRFDE